METNHFSYCTADVMPVDAKALLPTLGTLLALRPPSSKADSLCAAEFAAMGARLHVILTERLDDTVAILSWNRFHDFKKQLFSRTLLRPEGQVLVAPTAIADSEWDLLASHPRNRRILVGPKSERGEEFASLTQGVCFRLGRGRMVYLLTDGVAGVDVFDYSPGANTRVRFVSFLSFESEHECHDRPSGSATSETAPTNTQRGAPREARTGFLNG